ncbi:hypothetical protein M6D76_00235 [Alcaligenes faecalis]|uniref:hypothetical protein n=1 Tax=Alcaligenes faecalis TaxID=511 RepID=UPI00211BD97B|nr:hypothetical protein [Alcaligenes faecalis]UUO11168.1 hypothetical protein M6D76_00235 [Alcaligenes faecalis]
MLSGYWWPDHYQALLELADEATSARDAVGFDLANIESMALLSFPRSAHEYPAVVQLRQVDEAVLGHSWTGAGYRREAGQVFHARQDDGGEPPALLSDALEYRAPYLYMAPTAAVLRTMREAPTQGRALLRGDIGNIFAVLEGEMGQGGRLSMFRLLIRSQAQDSDAVRAEYGNKDALPFYSAMMMAEARARRRRRWSPSPGPFARSPAGRGISSPRNERHSP